MTGRRSLLLAAVFLSYVVGAADNGSVSQVPDSGPVDKIFAAWNKPDVPGCALGVVKDGRTIYSAGYGMANIEHSVRNGANTVFHIASVSKQFTAFAIHLLAQDGKLSLDDDVRKYLPELHDFGATITIRNLIHHTSGLRDQWNLLAMAGWRLEDVITEADILNLVWRQKELNFPPGQEELYSNTGYTLLGVIVKRVSGKSLREFAAERIFQPLKMQSTRFQDDYGFVVKNRASSYGRQPDGSYKYIALSYSNVGATSLFTTIEDLARWDQNFYDASVGGQSLLANMHVKGKLASGKEINYASALVIGEYRGLKTVEHGGGDAAFRTILLRFPDQRFSVITLCNAGDANPTVLARAVADVYLAKELAPKVDPRQTPKPAEVKVDAKILETYVGAYELRPGFVLTITLEEGQLKSQATGQGKFPIFASSEKDFFVQAFDAQITFERAPAGPAPALVLHQDGRNTRAPRITIVQPNPEQLNAYPGDYYSPELNVVYAVTVHEGRVLVRHPRGESPASPTTEHAFAAPYPLGTLRFQCESAPRCSGFTVSNGRVRNLRFQRVELKQGG